MIMPKKTEFNVEIYRTDDLAASATLSLPATWAEYQDAMEKARVFDLQTPYKFEILHIEREYLRPHMGDDAITVSGRELLELNLLAQRLAMQDDTLNDSVEAMIKMDMQKANDSQAPIPLARLINLTFASEDCMSVYLTSHKELGEFLFENDMLDKKLMDKTIEMNGLFGKDIIPDEWFLLIGRQHCESVGGVFTKQGYFEYLEGDIEEIYKPGEMAYFDRSGAPVVLEICKGHFSDPEYDNDLTSKLDCPLNDHYLTAAIDAVEAASVDEIGWHCTECLIPAAREWIDDEEDFETVQDFAAFLSEMQRRQPLETQVKYKAILEAIGCDSLGKALYFGTELDEYYLHADMATAADYGKAFLTTNYGADGAKELAPHMNLYQYGNAMMEQFNAVNTPYGILRRADGGQIQSEIPDENRQADQEETVSAAEIYTSQDFQCDHTSGYPTVLVWNQDNGTAILQPAPAFDDGTEESDQCIRECAEWGVHPCTSWEDYNGLLESIGEDAVRNAYVSDEDESEEFGGMTMQ